MTAPTEASLKLAREFMDEQSGRLARVSSLALFLDRVRAEALEEAAKVANRYQLNWTEDVHALGWDDAVSVIEQGIRALIPKGAA